MDRLVAVHHKARTSGQVWGWNPSIDCPDQDPRCWYRGWRRNFKEGAGDSELSCVGLVVPLVDKKLEISGKISLVNPVNISRLSHQRLDRISLQINDRQETIRNHRGERNPLLVVVEVPNSIDVCDDQQMLSVANRNRLPHQSVKHIAFTEHDIGTLVCRVVYSYASTQIAKFKSPQWSINACQLQRLDQTV